MEETQDYLFILRAWQEGEGWRWSLMRSGDTERQGFSDLDSLYLFLSSLTEELEDADGDVGDKPAD